MNGKIRKISSPIIVLLLWEFASRSAFLLDPLLVPPPTEVFAELYRLIVSAQLFEALWSSMRRVFLGFGIAIIISVTLGVLMARIRIIEDFVDPLVELVRPVSPLAIFPLAILWFGIGDASKVFLIALSCSFPIILNTYAGVKGGDAALIRAGHSLGSNKWEVIRYIVLPSSLPDILTGIRVAWGIALIVIIASEMVGATTGMGYMVLEAQQTFNVERVFAGIIVIGVLGFLTDRALRWFRRMLVPWHQEYREQ